MLAGMRSGLAQRICRRMRAGSRRRAWPGALAGAHRRHRPRPRLRLSAAGGGGRRARRAACAAARGGPGLRCGAAGSRSARRGTLAIALSGLCTLSVLCALSSLCALGGLRARAARLLRGRTCKPSGVGQRGRGGRVGAGSRL